MSRPKIKITLIDRKGKHGCHRGHKIGDSFDFDEDYNVYLTEDGFVIGVDGSTGFSLSDLYYVTGVYQEDGTAVFCCPDVDTINVFRIEIVE